MERLEWKWKGRREWKGRKVEFRGCDVEVCGW